MCSSADGTATADCPAPRSGSANRRRSCSATCAWCGPSRCCATAASTPPRWRRAWPRYDEMRTELAVGQFADIVNDVGGLPTLDAVLEVARRKSGNYTVRRPLEIGAAMAGCGDRLLAQLGGYGEAVGEAFQLRDDLLGIFGSPAITGKPVGGDLTEHKATSVVVAAHHMADPTLRRELTELMSATELDETDVGRWRDPDRRDRRGPADRRDDRRPAAPRIGMDRRRAGSTERCVRRCSTWLRSAPSGRHDAHRRGYHRPRRGRRRGPGRACRPRCTWPAAGVPVTVVERGDVPGGRVGRLDVDGYRLDTGPTVLTMPDLIDETFAAVGESTADRLELAAGRPRLPRAVRRRQLAGRAQRPRRDGRRGRAVRRAAAGRRATCGCATGSPGCIEVEFDGFIAAELRLPAVAVDPAAGPAGGARRLPPLGPGGEAVHHRSRGCTGSSPSRRSTRGSRRSGRSRSTPSSPTWTPSPGCTSRAAECGRCPMRWPPPPRTPASNSATAQRYRRWTARRPRQRRATPTDGERIDADAVVLTTELPDTYRLLGRTPRRLLPLRPSPSAVVAHVGCRSAGPRNAAPPHPFRRRVGADVPRHHRRRAW